MLLLPTPGVGVPLRAPLAVLAGDRALFAIGSSGDAVVGADLREGHGTTGFTTH